MLHNVSARQRVKLPYMVVRLKLSAWPFNVRLFCRYLDRQLQSLMSICPKVHPFSLFSSLLALESVPPHSSSHNGSRRELFGRSL